MKCRVCGTLTDRFLPLAPQAPSNSLQDKPCSDDWSSLPLDVYTCSECELIQIKDTSRFVFKNDYPFFSGVSEKWRKRCTDFASRMITSLNLDDKSRVLEIAANDGTLINNFVRAGIESLAIEPCKSVADVCEQGGAETIREFFSFELSDKIANKRRFDLIVANNVIAHVSDPNDFMAGVRNLLKSNGVAAFEFPDADIMLEQTQFDTIYHEHMSYFNLSAFTFLAKRNGLSILSVERIKDHGGSLRIFLKKSINREKLIREFDYKVEVIREKTQKFLMDLKGQGKSVCGFGAAAKGHSFINSCCLRESVIPYIVDETPAKIGKFTPTSSIPIIGMQEFQMNKKRPDYIILLAWNHLDEIKNKHVIQEMMKAGTKLVTFIPDLVIHETR